MIPEETAKEIESFEEGKQKAVNSYKKDGKYLVIAGPGTGKTFTVTKRIQAILSDDEIETEADRLLCLTFSDAAAKEMRLKLEKEHVRDAAGVNIFTYHSFCMNLMEEYPELFDTENKKMITSVKKQVVVKECLDELEDKGENERIKLFRSPNNLYDQIEEIVKGIEAIKHNRLTPAKVRYNLEHNPGWIPLLNEFETKEEKEKHREKIDKIEELLRIYDLYIEKTKDYIDFDDMINNVLDKFEQDAEFIDKVSKQYDYIMVDEYQDTNKSQNDIVFQLAKHCKNIFVVGDDDQIIYSFQGASLDTIQNFREAFKNELTVISLIQNRRSTPTILKAAEELASLQDEYPRLILKNPDIDYKLRFMSKELKAYNDDLKNDYTPVKIYEFSDEKQELQYITNEITEIINDKHRCPHNKKGEKLLNEIAVLTKTNADAYNYADKLKESGIRVQIAGGKNIFEINSVKVLIAYMQFMANPEQNPDKLYKFLLYKPFHIHPKDYAILHCKEIKDISGSSVIRRMEQAILISNNEEAKSTGKNNKKILADKEKLQNFINTYYELQNYITCETVKNSIKQIANKTGIFKCYLNIEINRTENYDALTKLIEEAETFKESFSFNDNLSAFKEFVNYINTVIDGEIKILTDKTEKPYNAVQVSTLHASKGREFEYVFMPRLNQRKFESNSKDDCKEIIPLEKEEIRTPLVNAGNIEKIKDKSSQTKFLNSAKLLYVGMTRAKHYLYMSYPKISRNGASKFVTQTIERLEEKEKNKVNKTIEYENKSDWKYSGERNRCYDKELKTAIDTLGGLKPYIKTEYLDEFNKAYEKLAGLKKIMEFTAAPDEAIMPDYDYKEEFRDYIIENIPEHYSVSSVNTYFDCPKQFLFKYILNLSPEENTDTDGDEMLSGSGKFIEWGIIIHYALENYVKKVIEEKKHLDYSVMEKFFDEELNEILPNEKESTVKEKKNNLEKYYKELLKTPAEKFFAAEKEIPEEKGKYIDIDGILFTGKIDRIDKNSDGTYNIYDYKTGINKSKTAAETKHDGKKEKIYNQLAFYKYVLEKYYGMTVKDAGIIFPEEPESSFTVDDLSGKTGSENAELVIKKFINSVKEGIIKSHNFECKKGCKRDEYCHCEFKEFCKSMVI